MSEEPDIEHEDDEYLSYNGLSRKALFIGIPLIPFFIFFFLMVLTGYFGVQKFGVGKGLIAPFLFSIPLIYMRIKCANDSTALDKIYWEFKGLLLRLKTGRLTLSILATINKTNRFTVNDFFKRITKSKN